MKRTILIILIILGGISLILCVCNMLFGDSYGDYITYGVVDYVGKLDEFMLKIEGTEIEEIFMQYGVATINSYGDFSAETQEKIQNLYEQMNDAVNKKYTIECFINVVWFVLSALSIVIPPAIIKKMS